MFSFCVESLHLHFLNFCPKDFVGNMVKNDPAKAEISSLVTAASIMVQTLRSFIPYKAIESMLCKTSPGWYMLTSS